MKPAPTQSAETTSTAPPRVFAFWDGGSASADLPPEGAELVIGREPTCALSVAHASVSREHAVIRGGDPPSICDLGSRNGTSVGGRRLAEGEEVALPFNQVVTLGSTSLIVQGSRRPKPPGVESAGSAMREVHRLVDVVAKSDISVILIGETGVGKELIAARLHAASRRASGPLVRLNCAALAESLLESELFGHERGAFTGALATKQGLFEAADGGTIVLDEIGEISLATQVKLLRVLESREVLRVGALKPRTVDVRVIAATHRDLPSLVASGAFREDLFFRLNGITIVIPPLRERTDEILALAESFVRDASARASHAPPALTREATEALLGHEWPGNVRELKATMERAVVLSQADASRAAPRPIDVVHLGLVPRRRTPVPEDRDASLPEAVQALERRRIEDALRACNGNQTAAAKILGISRRTLVYRLGALGIRPKPT